MTTLISRPHSGQPEMIVLEASGDYERLVTAALTAAEFPAAVINSQRSAPIRCGKRAMPCSAVSPVSGQSSPRR